MYKKIKSIDNVDFLVSIVQFSTEYFFIIDSHKKNIKCFDLKSLILSWETTNEDWQYLIVNDFIVGSNLNIYSLNGKSLLNNNEKEWYSLVFSDNKNLVVYKTVNEEQEIVLYHIFDLKQKQFYMKNIEAKYPEMFIKDDFFICTDKGEISLYNYNTQNKVWQQDLSEITSYKDWWGEHKGEVKRVYSYKDKIIVSAGKSVLALELETGTILWQIKFEYSRPIELYIVGNTAYLGSGVYYSGIDLDMGIELFEMEVQRPFDINPKYPNSNLAVIAGSEMTYREGYFYFTDKTEKYYYLAKMKPETGIIEDYQILDGITSNLAPPKFHDNKMFLLDSRNTLHIYEKEK